MTEEWIVVIRQIVGTVECWETACSWDGERYASKQDAIDAGWRIHDHDDFNIGRVEGNQLAWFGWMDDELPEDLAAVAEQVGLTAAGAARGVHVGRSWTGSHLEDSCPCPKEPCGLVDIGKAHPSCPEHPGVRAKTIRRSHPASECPGLRERQAS